jgi:hypothetical protein
MQRLFLLLLSTGFVLIALIGNAVQVLDVVRVSDRAAVADTAVTGRAG